MTSGPGPVCSFSPTAVLVLQQARREAIAQGTTEITPEHFRLALDHVGEAGR